jgi:hypothetical protein
LGVGEPFGKESAGSGDPCRIDADLGEKFVAIPVLDEAIWDSEDP